MRAKSLCMLHIEASPLHGLLELLLRTAMCNMHDVRTSPTQQINYNICNYPLNSFLWFLLHLTQFVLHLSFEFEKCVPSSLPIYSLTLLYTAIDPTLDLSHFWTTAVYQRAQSSTVWWNIQRRQYVNFVEGTRFQLWSEYGYSLYPALLFLEINM